MTERPLTSITNTTHNTLHRKKTDRSSMRYPVHTARSVENSKKKCVLTVEECVSWIETSPLLDPRNRQCQLNSITVVTIRSFHSIIINQIVFTYASMSSNTPSLILAKSQLPHSRFLMKHLPQLVDLVRKRCMNINNSRWKKEKKR